MPGTILVVHRDDALLRAIQELLLLDGYDVACAREAHDAGRLVARGLLPDVVVVDEESVGEGGYAELCGVAAAAPRVLLTWKPRAMHPPGVITIGKPFRARDLRAAVADLLVPAVRPPR